MEKSSKQIMDEMAEIGVKINIREKIDGFLKELYFDNDKEDYGLITKSLLEKIIKFTVLYSDTDQDFIKKLSEFDVVYKKYKNSAIQFLKLHN